MKYYSILLFISMMMITIIGCTSKIIGIPINAQNINTIEGTKWTLIEIVDNKQKADIPQVSVPFIEFKTSDNQVVGMSGCNRFFSTYSFDGKKIKFGDIAGTKMACEQMEMDIENHLLYAFDTATEIRLDENKLLLVKDKEVIATFKK